MIETERLILRPFCEDDLDIIFRLYSNEEIMKYMPYECMDLDAAKKHLSKVVQDWKKIPLVNCEMAVISRQSQEKIGRCRIHIDTESDTAMIGWLLLKEEWGKGYATEITTALLDYCFHVLHMHRV